MATKRPRNNAPLDPGGGAGAAPGPAKRAAVPFAGAILVTYRLVGGKVELLLGRETKFLTDVHKEPVRDATGQVFRVEELQKVEKTRYPNSRDARNKFIQRAKWLSGILGYQVLADIVEPSPDGKLWTVHFRVSHETSKFGFVKGHRKDDEEPLNTVLREFAEETGTMIDRPENLVEIGGTFPRNGDRNYIIFVNHAATGSPILRYFQSNRLGINYGELSELQFRPLNEIWGLFEHNKLNSQTRSAIDTFFLKYHLDQWEAITKTEPIDPTAPGGAGAGAAPGGAGATRGGTRRSRAMRRNRRGKTRRTK